MAPFLAAAIPPYPTRQQFQQARQQQQQQQQQQQPKTKQEEEEEPLTPPRTKSPPDKTGQKYPISPTAANTLSAQPQIKKRPHCNSDSAAAAAAASAASSVPTPVPPPSPSTYSSLLVPPSPLSKTQQPSTGRTRPTDPRKAAQLRRSQSLSSDCKLSDKSSDKPKEKTEMKQQQQQQERQKKVPAPPSNSNSLDKTPKVQTYQERKEQQRAEKKEDKKSPVERSEVVSSILDKLDMKMLAPNMGPLRSPTTPSASAMVLQSSERFRRDPRKRPTHQQQHQKGRPSRSPPSTQAAFGTPSPTTSQGSEASRSTRPRDPRLERRLSQELGSPPPERRENSMMLSPPPPPLPSLGAFTANSKGSAVATQPPSLLTKPQEALPSDLNLFSAAAGASKQPQSLSQSQQEALQQQRQHRLYQQRKKKVPTEQPKTSSASGDGKKDPLEGLLVRSKATSSWKRSKSDEPQQQQQQQLSGGAAAVKVIPFSNTTAAITVQRSQQVILEKETVKVLCVL